MTRHDTIIILLALASTWSAPLLRAQIAHPADPSAVHRVEHNLTPDTDIIFADSVLERFTIQERMKHYGVPSLSLCVVDSGRIQWAKAYGPAGPYDSLAADTTTLYQAASISKTVTALCVLRLVQEGVLSLDTDIRTYLRSWKLPENTQSLSTPITLRQILSHSAGLSTRGFMGYTQGDTLPSLDEILEGVAPARSEAVRVVSKPGTEFSYSGGGTVLIRKILEDRTGRPFSALVEEHVLRPLGMHASTFAQPLPAAVRNFACGHTTTSGVIAGGYHIYPELAPDGLWTTPSDLARMVIGIQRSLAGWKEYLHPQEAEEMMRPPLSGSNAALGVFLVEKGGRRYFTHSGANVGYRSDYYGSIRNGKGVVILTNSDNADPLIQEVVNSVAIVYGWEGFYAPEERRLVELPDSLMDRYAGIYESIDPPMKIRIEKKRNMLELTARRPERMLFTAESTFFLRSSPSAIGRLHLDLAGTGIDSLTVTQGGSTIITARRRASAR